MGKINTASMATLERVPGATWNCAPVCRCRKRSRSCPRTARRN